MKKKKKKKKQSKKEYRRAYYIKNRKKLQAKSKKFYRDNLKGKTKKQKQSKAYFRSYYDLNKVKMAATARAHYLKKHPDSGKTKRGRPIKNTEEILKKNSFITEEEKVKRRKKALAEAGQKWRDSHTKVKKKQSVSFVTKSNDRKRVRSDNYQEKFHEFGVVNDTLTFLANFAQIHGCYGFNEQHQESLELEQLNKDLAKRLIKIAKKELPEMQWKVLHAIVLQGKTQWEAAIYLGIDQSMTFKLLHGYEYISDTASSKGAIVGLRDLAAKDQKCIDMLERIKFIREHEDDNY